VAVERYPRVRYASSSLTSMPEPAKTSVSSAASGAFSTGRAGGGAIEPGGGGGRGFRFGMPLMGAPLTGLAVLGGN
jgi:hypothetical protein